MKGVLLLSGGLDSSLAGRILLDMGVDLVGLHLESPFGCDNNPERMANELGIPLTRKPKGEAFIEVLKEPAFGYGSAMNPCIDCRILMFQLGQSFMEEVGATFLVTGEVAGQRPMSQKKETLFLIDREAGMEGKVLRPLSARLLPETYPEQEGWVDRTRLYGWAGRSRKPQLDLAKQFGFSFIPSPAGGCLLTDSNFKERLGDFVRIDTNRPSEVAPLIRFGRHFRFDETWVIVGRDEEDNRKLEQLIRGNGMGFHPEGFSGPGIFFPEPCPADMETIAFGAFHVFGKRVPEGPLSLRAILGETDYTVTFHAPDTQSPYRNSTHWNDHWRH
ncbi:MAG: hypothetical protein ACYC9S_11160 [Leptospirales bacterium]